MRVPNGNGFLRSRAIYLVIIIIFFAGILTGWVTLSLRSTCEEVAAEQHRLIVAATVMADASRADGNENSARAWQSFVETSQSSLISC